MPFQFKWLRRFTRKYTKPIPLQKAASWKQRLSFAYMILGWNAFGLVCYMVYTGKSDWVKYYGLKTEQEAAVPPAQQWAKTLGIEKATVYRLSGLKKEYEYKLEDGEKIEEANKNSASI